MSKNYFSEMLLAKDDDIRTYMNKLKERPIDSCNYIPPESWKAILILWMHSFFHNSDGYGKFKPFLRDVFLKLFAENIAESYYDNVLKYLQIHYCQDELYGAWFYKHCWMISGEKCGATSKMPRPVLNYLDDEDEGLENEDYTAYPIFENMLQDKSAAKNFHDIIHNISEYPVLEEAIKRFRKMASAEIDWYLCKNGYSMKIILGIKKIRLPESDTSANIEVMIKFKNEVIRITVARTRDRVEVPIEDIKNSDSLKIYINGTKIDEIDCSAVFSRFDNIDIPLCFQCPMDPAATWFKLLPEKMEYPYNKNAIWIVVAVENGGNMVANEKRFKCKRIELKLSDELQTYAENGYELFKYQKTCEYITIEGNRRDICDDAHKWIIFSGERLFLTSTNQNEWDKGMPRYECKPNNPQSPCSFSIKNKRKKNFSILYLPEEFVKKCQNGEAWESNGWKYEPEIIPKHPNIVRSIQSGIYGTLSMPAGKTLTLFVNIEPSEQIYWLEENWQSYEKLENIDIRDFESYGDMEKYKLCFPFQQNIESFEVKCSGSDTWKKFPIVTTVGGRYKWINLQDLTSRINPSFSEGYDEIKIGNCSFKVKCLPSTPQILINDNCGEIYIPEKEKKNYSLVILSEKALESFSDWTIIPCSELSLPCQDIPIPEDIKKHPQAIYATLIKASPSLDLLSLLQKREIVWKKIRNSEKPINELFKNSVTLEVVLPMLPQSENFSDAKEFVLLAQTSNPQELWDKLAGNPNSPYDIPKILKIMLEKGFNFLAEPAEDKEEIKLKRKDFPVTWLSYAFHKAMINHNNNGRMTKFSSFSTVKETIKNKDVDFLKEFLENQDEKGLQNSNLLHGKGWLPVCLFQYLLEERGVFDKDIEKIKKKNFEECGIREVSIINNFSTIWNIQCVDSDAYREGYYRPPYTFEKDSDANILLPKKETFLKGQKTLYVDRLEYLNSEEEEQILYSKEDFDKTCNILKCFLKQENSGIGEHLRICFSWILENIKKHIEEGNEDLNHAVLGVTAIICRLIAHTRYNLNDEDKQQLLMNVSKAFRAKFERQSEEKSFVGDCWRFLMYYIPPVDLVLWFYNSTKNRKVVWQ